MTPDRLKDNGKTRKHPHTDYLSAFDVEQHNMDLICFTDAVSLDREEILLWLRRFVEEFG